jgi:hypothetical protein
MKQFKIKTLSFDFKQFYKWHTVPFIKQFEYETFCFISKQFLPRLSDVATKTLTPKLNVLGPNNLLCQIDKMYKCIQNIQYKSTYRKQQ